MNYFSPCRLLNVEKKNAYAKMFIFDKEAFVIEDHGNSANVCAWIPKRPKASANDYT